MYPPIHTFPAGTTIQQARDKYLRALDLLKTLPFAFLALGVCAFNTISAFLFFARSYLPGNGGTVLAVGLMAGGWAGAPDSEAPGFPSEWGVRAEGFTPFF